MSGPAVIERLSPRQRDCLRLVGRGRTSKEIGLALGVSHKTVSGYIAEAMATLGAQTRGEAAELLRRHEGEPSPDIFPGAPVRGDEDGEGSDPERGRGSVDWRSWLPVRRKGSAHNELHPIARLVWIVAIAAFLLGVFGLFVGALDTVTGLYARFGY